jgi:hypothetical protein
MSDAILTLRSAIQAHLAAHSALTALIGAGRIHDEAPRAAKGVYITHGEVDAQDWSTGSDSGCEQQVSLVVWAAEGGSSKLALQAASVIVAALNDAPLTLSGHRLIDLAWRSTKLSRDAATKLAAVTIRFRAVSEAL